MNQIISVIIPAFNEEASIGLVVNDIPKEIVKHVIVVNNGSTDNTVEVAKKAGAIVVGVAVIVERKVGNGSWKKIATVKTDATGKWALTRTTGANSLTVSYRAKTSDSRLGVLVSTSKTTKVK